jgi:hypothetical protein
MLVLNRSLRVCENFLIKTNLAKSRQYKKNARTKKNKKHASYFAARML